MIKTSVSELYFWKANLKELIAFVEKLDEEEIDLDIFSGDEAPNCEHTCGSVACLGGWTAVMPYFKKLGVKREKRRGSPYFKLAKKSASATDGDYIDQSRVASHILFGDRLIFDASRAGENLSHKEAALKRLRSRLKAVKRELKDRLE